jgi:predicted adenine nucleotide alpha hydrolase (AANH) superfamily ATPase
MRLLLHVCCGPDVTVALERVPETEKLCIYFDNPNIHPFEEYARRMAAFYQVACHYGAECLIGEYDPEYWQALVEGHEDDPEGGERCMICIGNRLKRTAEEAVKKGYDTIGSVFSTSPLKNAAAINELGLSIARKQGLHYLESDYKKKDGFKRSIEISRELKLYRQNFCGCIHSVQEEPRGGYEKDVHK